MLRKLLKYDLQYQLKFLSIFYMLAIFFSLLARAISYIEDSMVAFVISEIFKGAAISMMFSALINNIMRLWARFRGSLYGDEAYLTHTLPIKKSTVYLSKIITALITILISFIVIAVSLFIIFYSKELFEMLKAVLIPFAEGLDISAVGIILTLLLVLYLEIVNLFQCGFTGIILGHRMNTAKIGFSVLFSFIAYSLTQTFVLLCLFIVALFNSEFMNMFITNAMPNMDTLKTVIYFSTLCYVLLVLAVGFINIRLFKKGVDVD